MIEKKEIRRRIKEKRELMPEETMLKNSAIIKDKLLQRKEYKEAKEIYIYMSFEGEVDTRKIIEESIKQGKKVAIPKIIEEQMRFFYIDSIENTEVGYYGILEPKGTERNESKPDGNSLIIMPGVAFDYQMNRIGYGKGFYDKYLSKNKFSKKFALAFDFQIFESISNNKYDVKPDIIITENKTIE